MLLVHHLDSAMPGDDAMTEELDLVPQDQERCWAARWGCPNIGRFTFQFEWGK
jgi:hypothetical protein